MTYKTLNIKSLSVEIEESIYEEIMGEIDSIICYCEISKEFHFRVLHGSKFTTPRIIVEMDGKVEDTWFVITFEVDKSNVVREICYWNDNFSDKSFDTKDHQEFKIAFQKAKEYLAKY